MTSWFRDQPMWNGETVFLSQQKLHAFLLYSLSDWSILGLTNCIESTRSFQSGISLLSDDGLSRHPLRIWEPTISPFSKIQTEISLFCFAASVLRRIAVANPAHPAYNHSCQVKEYSNDYNIVFHAFSLYCLFIPCTETPKERRAPVHGRRKTTTQWYCK